MKEETSDYLEKVVDDLAPKEWDKRPAELAHKIREFLKTLIDSETSIDSGRGPDLAELWPKIGGAEYHIVVTVSRELAPPIGSSIQ